MFLMSRLVELAGVAGRAATPFRDLMQGDELTEQGSLLLGVPDRSGARQRREQREVSSGNPPPCATA